MVRLFFFVLCFLMISGCSSQSGSTRADGKLSKQESEKLLIASDNHLGLVELYKTELLENDNFEARYKLAKNYLKLHDPEMALFYLKPVLKSTKPEVKYIYLQATAQYDLGNAELAKNILKDLLVESPKYAVAYNFIGVINAEQGHLVEAKNAFKSARDLMFDDVTVKNNLAVIDLIEQNYEVAIGRLLPLYVNGNTDERIKANLLIAMVKAGQFDKFKTLLNANDEEEAYQLFHALYAMKPAGGSTYVQ